MDKEKAFTTNSETLDVRL